MLHWYGGLFYSAAALADKENLNPYLAIVMKGNDPTVNIDMTEDKSGEGWSFDASIHTLILDGLNAQNIQLFNAEYPVAVEIAGDSSLAMEGRRNRLRRRDAYDRRKSVWTS